MAKKDCIEILKNSSSEIHKYLEEKAGVFDGSEKSKEAYRKAAKELQEHSVKTINDIYSDLGIKGFTKTENPVQEKASITDEGVLTQIEENRLMDLNKKKDLTPDEQTEFIDLQNKKNKTEVLSKDDNDFVKEAFDNNLIPSIDKGMLSTDGEFDAKKIPEYLKAVSEQATGIDKNGKPLVGGAQEETMIKQGIPKEIIKLAKDTYPAPKLEPELVPEPELVTNKEVPIVGDALKDVESTTKALQDVNNKKEVRFFPDDKVILKTKDGKEVEVSFRGYNGENKAVIFGDRGSGVGQMEVDVSQLRRKSQSDKLSEKERNNLLSKIDLEKTKYWGKGLGGVSDAELNTLANKYPKWDKLSQKEKQAHNDFESAITPIEDKIKSDYGGDDVNTIAEIRKEHAESIANTLANDNYSEQVSEAYHKAKADGSNPGLVKAVEEAIGLKPKSEVPIVGDNKDLIDKVRANIKELPDKDFEDKEANDNWKSLQKERKKLLTDDNYLLEQIKNVEEKKAANQTVFEAMFNADLPKSKPKSEVPIVSEPKENKEVQPSIENKNKELIPERTVEAKKFSEKAKEIADKIRSGKINKLGGFKSSTGFDFVWDTSLEVVAKTIEAGGKIADAIEAGLKHVRESEWYKSLNNKKDFEDKYRDHLNEELSAEKPPKPPIDKVGEDIGEGGNKGLLNRLYTAKGTPEAAKEGFKVEGLSYEPKSQKEAEGIAKSVIDELGMDESVLQAKAQTFGGDVNTLIQTESLNRLAELSDKETDPAKKLEYDKKFAEIGIGFDEWLRKQGRGISAVNYFYKKSPLGIQMIENAKRKQDFEQWSKPKEKSWKEFFDEMVKEPEFEAIVKEQVREGMKKERAESRAARIKKVDDAIDSAKAQFSKGATYATLIPPKVITTALEGIKQAYHAGEHVVKIVQDAIDYISKELGHDTWDKEKFKKEWEEKLADKEIKKPLTDEEVKTRILEKFRKKLKGLSDSQKEDVVRKSFQKIVESGGLDYADFKKIIADITGRGELTPEEGMKLKELVTKINSVEDAGKKAREVRTVSAINKFRETELEAGKATRELNEMLYNKPNILKRLNSLMQLNTLGFAALVNNPIYNVWNQATLRFPIGLINTAADFAISKGAKALGKDYAMEYNITLTAQKEFFRKLGFGAKESAHQLFTGLNREDYIQKEIHGQNIRPISSLKDLWAFAKGKKALTKTQVIDKAIQGSPPGMVAEVIARVLNLGDKPQRFAAEGAQAAAFAETLGLKGIDYNLFIEFPREEAYRNYKAKGLSDAEAGKKADYVKDVIIKEGKRSTFQQDNWLNDKITKLFGGESSGVGSIAKTLIVSPYIKIPTNAFWSYYNLINPEIAVLQSMVHGYKAFKNRGKGDNSSSLNLRESRYWIAHAVTGVAMRGVVASLVAAGIYTPSNTGDDTKKEREGEGNFEPQGTVNVSKLKALLSGQDPTKVKNGVTVSNKWFGQWGTVGNAIARKYEDATPEQRAAQDEFWNIALGKMEVDGLKDFEQGVFANSSALLGALNDKGSFGLSSYGVNTVNLFTNIVYPAALAQIEKASLPYYSTVKADTFLGEVKNAMLQRSSIARKITGQYPPAKISIWGDTLKREGNIVEKVFGINNVNKDNFAQPIYEDAKRTGDIGYFPPAIPPKLSEIKLNTEQSRKLQGYVGKARKDYVAPYVNNQATIEGFHKKYEDLNDTDKKYVLNYLYELGKEDGTEKFIKEYPEFKKSKKEKDQVKENRKKAFREFQKNKN